MGEVSQRKDFKMKMDYNSSDQSPPLSDNNGSSWGQCWDNEDSSLSGLNFGKLTLKTE